MRGIITKLTVHGKVLVTLDQPTASERGPSRSEAAGATVGYLSELAIRRVAEHCRGQAKTDALDAVIIAEASRSMPCTLLSVELNEIPWPNHIRGQAGLPPCRTPRRSRTLQRRTAWWGLPMLANDA